MNLTELLDAVRDDPGAITIPAHWAQGRTCFGGLMVALLYEAMRGRLGDDRPLRSLVATFVAPPAAETPIAFEVEVVRQGKSVSHMLGRALQDGEITTLAQASFGAARESRIEVSALPAPALPPMENATPLPYIPGVTPECFRHFDLRWALGGMPFTGTASREVGGYVQLREPGSEVLDVTRLLALADAWPPAVLPHLTRPTPGSSLTWTIEFVHPLPVLRGDDYLRYRAVIEHARDGYGHTAATLWSPSGELVAISRQTVTVFG